ncbi:hypothetical protein HG530_002296 [Fusarium avenaceum]|nr:hypothetical protein HG530_002296 [Fusarium avenaceum]
MPIIHSRHNRAIRNPKPLNPPNLQLLIHHSIRVVRPTSSTRTAGVVARRRVVLDVLLPVLARLELVVRQLRRPRSLDQVLGARTLGDDLVAERARFGEDFEVQRVREVVAVHDGDGARVGIAEGDGAA